MFSVVGMKGFLLFLQSACAYACGDRENVCIRARGQPSTACTASSAPLRVKEVCHAESRHMRLRNWKASQQIITMPSIPTTNK